MSSTSNTPTANGGALPEMAMVLPSPFTKTLLSVTIVFLVLATIAVGIRIHAARISRPSFGRLGWMSIDLVLIIAALVVTYGMILATILGAAYVGLDTIGDRLNVEDASEFIFKVYFADVIVTTVASGLCKCSILEFYKRIFIMEWFHVICNIFIFLVSAWMIGTFFAQLFSTTPISSAWHANLEYQDANYDYPTFLLAVFGIGIVLDVMVLCLPIRPIAQLQLKWQNKLKISLVLGLGVFCVICTAVRFYYSYEELENVFTATAAQKGAITTNASMWSQLEPSASIIAACLPTFGPIVNSRNLGSMVASARSLFSIRSRSRSVLDSSREQMPSKEGTQESSQIYTRRLSEAEMSAV